MLVCHEDGILNLNWLYSRVVHEGGKAWRRSAILFPFLRGVLSHLRVEISRSNIIPIFSIILLESILVLNIWIFMVSDTFLILKQSFEIFL